MTLENEVVENQVTILANPKIVATEEDYSLQQDILERIETNIKSIHESVSQMRSAKKQLKTYGELLKEQDKAKTLLEEGDALVKQIEIWEEKLIQPKQKTFQDVINYNNQLNAELMHLKGFVDSADPVVTEGAKNRLDDLQKEWKVFEDEKNTIINKEMKAYNELYKSLELPAIIMEGK
jgi:hypothetical protein